MSSQSCPGTLTSSIYSPWPRRKRGSSLRLTEWPMPPISGDVFGAILCASLAHFLSSVLICLHDVDVAGAAAEISRNRVTDLVVRRSAVRFQKRVSSHQHARRAISALQPVL